MTQYTDDEIVDAFKNWKTYRKPTLTKIRRPRRQSRKEQQWGKRRNWGHGRRG